MRSIFFRFCLVSVIVSTLVSHSGLQRAPVVNTVGLLVVQSNHVLKVEGKTPHKEKYACYCEKVANQMLQARKA